VFRSQGHLPEVNRSPVDPTARAFVYFFALVPVPAMTLFVLLASHTENFVIAPLVVLSGLAVIVAAGDRIQIAHQYLIGVAWAALLVLPPVLVAVAMTLMPWTFTADLRVGRPAAAMGNFFADNFQRRTSRPLSIVTGDLSMAALVALGARTRPSPYIKDAPVYAPNVKLSDLEEKGGVVVWPSSDTSGRPPPSIKQQFPDLVPEVPHVFERWIQGLMPPARIGWGVIRPRAQTPAAAPATPAPASKTQ
jgi:hypothetical protein